LSEYEFTQEMRHHLLDRAVTLPSPERTAPGAGGTVGTAAKAGSWLHAEAAALQPRLPGSPLSAASGAGVAASPSPRRTSPLRLSPPAPLILATPSPARASPGSPAAEPAPPPLPLAISSEEGGSSPPGLLVRRAAQRQWRDLSTVTRARATGDLPVLSPRSSARQQALLEFFDSEQAYRSDLDVLINVFLVPLRAQRRIPPGMQAVLTVRASCRCFSAPWRAPSCLGICLGHHSTSQNSTLSCRMYLVPPSCWRRRVIRF
jgi:hypothetical protein